MDKFIFEIFLNSKWKIKKYNVLVINANFLILFKLYYKIKIKNK